MLLPHLIWEPLLLAMVVLVAAAVTVRVPLLDSDGIWWTVAFYGLLASGLALSLRTATPNLAVTGSALAAAVVHVTLVTEADFAPVLAGLAALVVVVTIGLLLGLVAGLTSVPAWAVSLAGLALLQGFGLLLAGSTSVGPVEPLPAPLTDPYLWVGTFVVVSLAGGAVFAIPSLRRVFGASRVTTDPVRFSAAGLPGALVGFGGSSALAGLAGLALVTQIGGFTPVLANPFALFVALAAVLVGGVSGFGGRGGIAGTVLGVALVALVIRWVEIERLQFGVELGQSSTWLVAGLFVMVGVLVSRLVEAIAPLPPAQPRPTPPQAAVPAQAPGSVSAVGSGWVQPPVSAPAAGVGGVPAQPGPADAPMPEASPPVEPAPSPAGSEPPVAAAPAGEPVPSTGSAETSSPPEAETSESDRSTAAPQPPPAAGQSTSPQTPPVASPPPVDPDQLLADRDERP